MPASPIDVINGMETDLNLPVPILPTPQALRELQNSIQGEHNTPENRDALQRLLRHNLLQLDHDTIAHASHVETSNALRGLRNAVGMPLSRPEAAPQPEFVPVAGRETGTNSLNPGLRSPILSTGTAIGAGVLGTALLWNLFTNTGNTLKLLGKTAVGAGVAGTLAVGGWFGFNRMNWSEVGATLRGWGSGLMDTLSGGVGSTWEGALSGISSFVLGLTPPQYHQYLPDFIVRRSPEAQAKVKKAQEEEKVKEQDTKKKQEMAQKEATQKFREAAEKAIPLNVNLLNQVITLRPGLTLQISPVPSGQQPILVINGTNWRVEPTGAAALRNWRISNITRTGDGTYNISGQSYNINPINSAETLVTDHAAPSSFGQLFVGIEAIANFAGPLYTVPTPANSPLAALGGFNLRRQ